MSASVLILTKNIYSRIGGGEMLYRQMLQYSNSATFNYFCDAIEDETNIPSHVTAIPARSGSFSSMDCKSTIELALQEVRGRSFDIIDVPNFVPIGNDLIEILERLNIRYNRLVIACHGSLSDVVGLAWCNPSPYQITEISDREQNLLESADLLYGFSKSYLSRFSSKRQIYVRPHPNHLSLVSGLKLKEAAKDLSPTLVFIGRLDRCKGITVFLELLKFLPEGALAEVLVFTSVDENYSHGLDYIQKAASTHPFYVRVQTGKPQSEIFCEIQNIKPIIVVPSLFDTFNLVALESIVAQIPLLLSTQTGIYLQIHDELGGDCVSSLNVNDLTSGAKTLQNMIENYDVYRDKARGLAAAFVKDRDPNGYDDVLEALST